MTRKTDLEKLKESSLFREMTAEELATLGGLFQEKEMTEGTTVFLENMPGESLYLIRRGSIRISRMIAEGDEQILVILGPEDSFGEMAILDGAPRSATAKVAEAAHLLSLHRRDYETLCETAPKIALKLTRNIVRVFSRRLHENNEEYREMLLWSLGKNT